jgi:hypothetical protein
MQAENLIEGEGLQDRRQGLINKEVMEGTVNGQIEGFTKESEIGQPIFSADFQSFHGPASTVGTDGISSCSAIRIPLS